MPLSSAAKGTIPQHDDVALMRPLGARPLAVAVDLGAEEVRARVDAGGVDVVVLGEVAHLDEYRASPREVW
jgi:hypothetical protein